MISTLLMANLALQLPVAPLRLTGTFDVQGKASKIQAKAAKATVFFFVSTECPIANRYAAEIQRINVEYAKKGVKSYRVYVAEKGAAKDITKHGKEFSLSMPALLDPKCVLVKETGVRVTPEVAVINSIGVLVYRGRIDDQNIEHGVQRKDYRHDLRIALDELLAGKPISVPQTVALGCFLN